MAKRQANKSAVLSTEPRIRFNWGFWDGFAGAWRGRQIMGHFDPVYAAGVSYGQNAATDGEQPTTSDAAWCGYR